MVSTMPAAGVGACGSAQFNPGKPAQWAGALLVFLLLAAAVPPATSASQEVPGRILLELTADGARALRRGSLQIPIPVGGDALQPRIEPLFRGCTGPLGRFALVTFHPRPGSDAEQNRRWIAAMTASAVVVRGESDRLLQMAALPDDPYLTGAGGVPRQFQLFNPGGLSLRASRAWPFVPADREVVVAIIDTGVDWRHPDLGGSGPPATGVLWRNEAEWGGQPGVDDDGNGYVDDIIGWDFVDLDRDLRGIPVAEGEDAKDEDNDPSDFAGHGTEVAGHVTAITDNGIGLAGAAPGARLMVLRVGWLSAGTPVVYMSYTAQALVYAAHNGARVANCSWDSEDSFSMGAAIDEAVDEFGVVIVSSAGNGHTSNPSAEYVGQRNDCLAVAGVLSTGVKAAGSNYGSWVDIAAFYEGTPTTWFDRNTGESTYRVPPFGGTSFAAPQVTAEAALLRLVDPAAGDAQVRQWIRDTGRDLTVLDPVYGSQLGGGLADYAAAVEAAGGGWDRLAAGGGLTPFGDGTPSQFAFLGDSAVVVVGAEDGEAIAGWMGDAPAGERITPSGLPLVTPWPGTDSPRIVVFVAAGALRAVEEEGQSPAGWPVTLPEGAGQPVAAVRGGVPCVLVPHRDGVLAVTPDVAQGVRLSTLDLPADRLAVGQLDLDPEPEVVGVDSAGTLHVVDPDGTGQATVWTSWVGTVTAGPVIAQFEGTGLGRIVVAGPEPGAPGRQRILRVGGRGAIRDSVGFVSPPVSALSIAGFGQEMRVDVVAVDEAGGIHFLDPAAADPLAAGGPVAGEVLCADLDGDGDSDLLALRRDGLLLAWNAAGESLAGFPRRFPYGAAEAPLILDGPDRRHVMVADTTGGLWGLALGAAGGPAPWPAARAGARRAGYVDYDRATPVEAMAIVRWTWEGPGEGSLCWRGKGLEEFAALRVRSLAGPRLVPREQPLWRGEAHDTGCAVVPVPVETMELSLEGLGRDGVWKRLGAIYLPEVPRLRVGAPYPNPFLTSTRMTWTGVKGSVRVEVFDVTGRSLLARRLPPGSGGFTWNGRDEGNRPVPAGLYFFRVTDAARSVVRRVLKAS